MGGVERREAGARHRVARHWHARIAAAGLALHTGAAGAARLDGRVSRRDRLSPGMDHGRRRRAYRRSNEDERLREVSAENVGAGGAGAMKFIATDIPGVIVIEPQIFRDERGFFLESYHRRKYQEGGIDAVFVQDNHSRSQRGSIRGLHAQVSRPQGKLIRVIEGEVYDVAVDRKSTRLNSSHLGISYAVFCLKKKKKK